MKKSRIGRIVVLMAAVILFSLVMTASAAADHRSPSLRIRRDLSPYYEAVSGETVTLSIEADGGRGAELSYQWFANSLPANAPSASSFTLTVYNETDVYCVVSNGQQSVESAHCHIRIVSDTPRVPVSTPLIIVQPKSVDLSYGQTGILSVQAVCQNLGKGLELVYQWYSSPILDVRYATPISGANSANYIIPPSYTPNKLYYVCAIHSTNGVDNSQEVLTDPVSVYCGELNITKHPTGESVKAGEKATFIARADGAAAFEWRIVRNDGTNGFYRAAEAPSYISGLQVYGADSDTLVLANIPASMNGMNIICVFYGDAARTQYKITNSALLTVKSSPTPAPTATPYVPKVTARPAAKTVLAPSISVRPEIALDEDGQSVVLSVLAVDNNDDTELQFQWYKNTRNSNSGGTALSGAHSDSYVPVVLNAGRYYYVGVWATDGESESKIAYSEPVLVNKSAVSNLSGPLLAPSVSVRPELIASEDGKDVSLSVRAVDNNDDTELQFQWYKSKTNSVSGGKIIPGAENSQYVPVLSSDYKYYYVAVWATDGERTSKVAYSGPVMVG